MSKPDIPDQRDLEDFQRRHTLLYNLMHQADVWMSYISSRAKPETRSSVSILVLLTPGLLLTTICVLLLVLFRYDPPGTVWLYVYLGAALFMVLWSAEMGMRYTNLTLLQSDVEALNTEQARAYLSRNIPLQGLPGLITAIASVPITWFVYPLILQDRIAWPAYLFTFIAAFFWGEGIYIATATSLQFIKLVLEYDLPLYFVNPQQSVFIRRVSNLYEVVLWTTSASLVVLLSPWLFMEKTFWVNLIALIVGMVGLLTLALQFINGQSQLRRIVNKKKQVVMLDLQHQINQIYAAGAYTEKDNFAELQNLIKLHNQVATAQSWSLSATSTIRSLASFLPPVITIIFAQNKTFITIANLLADFLLQN